MSRTQHRHLTLHEVERRYLLAVLAQHEGDKVATAKCLGVNLTTIYRKLERYRQQMYTPELRRA